MTATTRFAATDRRAFTLVELLVVMSIIGVLAALMLPALSTALRFAENLGCQSNLKQISLAVLNYSADYKGAIPPTKVSGKDIYWCTLLVRGNYLPADDTSKLDDDEFGRKGVLQCPHASETVVKENQGVPYPAKFSGNDPAQGTARLGDSNFKVDCSYYWNGYIAETVAANTPYESLSPKQKRFPSLQVMPNDRSGIHDLGEMKNRTTTAMVMDGVLFDAESSGNRGRIAARHTGELGERGATNVAFYDNHVEALPRSPGENQDYAEDAIKKPSSLLDVAYPLFGLPKR